MNEHDLLVKLIEKSTESTNDKLGNLVDRFDRMDDEKTRTDIEHKEHERVSVELKSLLDDHIKQDTVIQKDISESLGSLNKVMEVNTRSLQEHMSNNIILKQLTEDNKGFIKELHEETQVKIAEVSNNFKKLHEDNSLRIGILEEPNVAKKYIKKSLIGLGIIAGSIGAIVKLYYMFNS